MSDTENFLSRWSRLKRDENPDIGGSSKPKSPGEAGLPEIPEAAAAGEVAPPFDPATLPPIETIDAGSDIRAFLAPGVPVDMRRAALRRAWSSDPSIRDFVGLSENSWDFNAPETIFGFGSIEKEKVQELLERVLGGPKTPAVPVRPSTPMESVQITQLNGEPDPAEANSAPPETALPAAEAPESVAIIATQDPLPHDSNSAGCPPDVKISQCDGTAIAPQNGSAPRRTDGDALPPRRRHGGALPE